jgi:hypothetical protein
LLEDSLEANLADPVYRGVYDRARATNMSVIMSHVRARELVGFWRSLP